MEALMNLKYREQWRGNYLEDVYVHNDTAYILSSSMYELYVEKHGGRPRTWEISIDVFQGCILSGIDLLTPSVYVQEREDTRTIVRRYVLNNRQYLPSTSIDDYTLSSPHRIEGSFVPFDLEYRLLSREEPYVLERYQDTIVALSIPPPFRRMIAIRYQERYLLLSLGTQKAQLYNTSTGANIVWENVVIEPSSSFTALSEDTILVSNWQEEHQTILYPSGIKKIRNPNSTRELWRSCGDGKHIYREEAQKTVSIFEYDLANLIS